MEIEDFWKPYTIELGKNAQELEDYCNLGQWEQVKGIVKETWGDLTDDEITQLEGNRQKLSGKIQERYGRAEDVVEKEIDDWSTRHDYRF